jgi:hypothetical protein
MIIIKHIFVSFVEHDPLLINYVDSSLGGLKDFLTFLLIYAYSLKNFIIYSFLKSFYS